MPSSLKPQQRASIRASILLPVIGIIALDAIGTYYTINNSDQSINPKISLGINISGTILLLAVLYWQIQQRILTPLADFQRLLDHFRHNRTIPAVKTTASNPWGKLVAAYQQVFREKLSNQLSIEAYMTTSHDGYWDWYLQDDYEYMSPRFWEILGFEPNEKEHHPKEWQALIFPEDLEIALENFNKHVESNGVYPFDQEVRYHHKNGSTVTVICRGQVVEWDDDGKPVRMIGTHTDITATKRALEDLRQKKHELQLIFDHVPASIWYKDDDLEVINSGEPRLGIIEEYTPKNAPRRWISTDKVPYIDRDTGVRGVFVVSQDITPLKEAQNKLAQLVEDLTESNEELERFVYVASHDLQEPLRMVTNFCQLLEKRYGGQLDETAHQYIEIANTAAKRMQLLVSDLLEYARVGNSVDITEHVDVGQSINFVLENLAQAIDESKAAVCFDTMPTITANRVRFCVLLQNLISNSIKYVGPDTTPHITIAATETEYDGTPVWQFSVTDNGIGMKQEYAEKIFQPFQRLHSKDEYSGTGIGLAMCRKIIESFGGNIWANSTLGKGSMFTFTIPNVVKSR